MPVYAAGISVYEDEWETLPTFIDYNYSIPVFTSLYDLKSFGADSEFVSGISGGNFKIYNLVDGVWTQIYENSSLTYSRLTKSLLGDMYAKRSYDVFSFDPVSGAMTNIYNGASVSGMATNLNNELYINSGYSIFKKVGGSFIEQGDEAAYNSSLICDGSNNIIAIEVTSKCILKQYGSSGDFIIIGSIAPDQSWKNTSQVEKNNKNGDIFIATTNNQNNRYAIYKINNNSDSISLIQTIIDTGLNPSFACDDDNNMYFTNNGKLYINFNSSGTFVQVQTPNTIYGPIANIGNDLLYKGVGNSIHRFVRQ